MIELSKIKERLEESFPGAIVTVSSPRRDDKHFETTIIYSEFAGKSLVDQHRMVYKALETEMPDIHALSIHTKVE